MNNRPDLKQSMLKVLDAISSDGIQKEAKIEAANLQMIQSVEEIDA